MVQETLALFNQTVREERESGAESADPVLCESALNKLREEGRKKEKKHYSWLRSALLIID